MKVTNAEGIHVFSHNDDDVNDLSIKNQTVIYMPDGIGEVFPTLKQLAVMSTRLKYLRRSNFKIMVFLKDLRLDNNEIEIIFSDTFWDLANLQWLSISGNHIKTLSEGLLLMCARLQWLTADDNQLEVFEQRYLRRNRNLELLSLRRNKLKEIKFEIKLFKSLAYIDFTDNICIDIAASNKNATALRAVQIEIWEHCKIHEVSSEEII